jgi:hypothetical protein
MKFLPNGEQNTCSLQKQIREIFQSQLGLSVRRNKACRKVASNMYWKATGGLRVACF